MNRLWLFAVLGAVLVASCRGIPERRPPDMVITPPTTEPVIEVSREYTIIDYKNKSSFGVVPEWVSLWLGSGISEIEALYTYQDSFVFVHRNEGNNFNALNLWVNGFSPELDFPRLVASRIGQRFSRVAVLYPDDEYGAFYEAIIRDASDTVWPGAMMADDFWILKRYLPGESEPENESWEFLILVTIGKRNFDTQLNLLFDRVVPYPPLTAEQITAVDRVKVSFYEGF